MRIAGTIGACIAMSLALAHGQQRTIFEEDGVIEAIEGLACGSTEAEEDNGRPFPLPDFSPSVRLVPLLTFPDQGWTLPEYADQAVVYLNGFSVSFRGSDHHAKKIGGMVGKSAIVNERGESHLRWPAARPNPGSDDEPMLSAGGTGTYSNGRAAGVELSDKSRTDPFRGCYHYVAVAWSTTEISAQVEQDVQVNQELSRHSNVTAALPRWRFPQRETTTIALPTAYFMDVERDDRHLRQYAYGLYQDRPGDDRMEATARAILKDNKRKSTIRFDGSVAGVYGVGVSLEQGEPMRITPVDRTCKTFIIFQNCISDASDGSTQDPVRRRVDRSFDDDDADFVLPVLTGFDLVQLNDDRHVQEIEVFVNNIDFDPATKDMRYTEGSHLTDKGDSRYFSRMQTSYLKFTKRKRRTDPRFQELFPDNREFERFQDRPNGN
ncbi:MAG: hypothetical protein AAF830_00695 [Pseudomonadota bacterium]